MRIQSSAYSDVGRRSNNEDSHLVAPELGVFAVADGMGGYEGGEIASRTAVDTLRAFYQRHHDDADATFPFRLDRSRTLDENMLCAAVRLAHRAIAARRVGRLHSMGSTVAALSVDQAASRATLAHVGDSRIYRLRGGRLEQLTRDHSLYEEVRAAGLHSGSKKDFAYPNVITRALGLGEQAEPDVTTVAVQPGDVFLLCSDGLTEPFDEAALLDVLRAAPGAQEAADPAGEGDSAQILVEAALAAGSKDNITAVVLKVA